MSPSDAHLLGALADAATRGPWVPDLGRFRCRVTTPGGADVADVGAVEDAKFIAAARAGWPETIEALQRAQVDLHDVKVAAEHAGNEHRAELAKAAALLGEMRADRDRQAQGAQLAGRQVREMAERLTLVEAELARLRPLGAAIERWARYRYSPELLASWDAYQASFKE